LRLLKDYNCFRDSLPARGAVRQKKITLRGKRPHPTKVRLGQQLSNLSPTGRTPHVFLRSFRNRKIRGTQKSGEGGEAKNDFNRPKKSERTKEKAHLHLRPSTCPRVNLFIENPRVGLLIKSAKIKGSRRPSRFLS